MKQDNLKMNLLPSVLLLLLLKMKSKSGILGFGGKNNNNTIE